MSLNSCVPVCVNVLANPVTNSVYYKAIVSRLPRQGCIPTEVGCKAQRIFFLEFCHTTRLWNEVEISCVCPLHQAQHLPSPGSCPALPPPPLISWVSLFTHLRVEPVLILSQGHRANQNCSGAFQGTELMIPLGKEFSKRSLLVTVL